MEETAKFVLVLPLLPPFPFRIFFFRQLFLPPPLLPTSRSHSWRPKLLLPLPSLCSDFLPIFPPLPGSYASRAKEGRKRWWKTNGGGGEKSAKNGKVFLSRAGKNGVGSVECWKSVCALQDSHHQREGEGEDLFFFTSLNASHRMASHRRPRQQRSPTEKIPPQTGILFRSGRTLNMTARPTAPVSSFATPPSLLVLILF